MNNFFVTIREGLSRVRKIWIISAVVILGLVLGLAGFASGAIRNGIAAFQGRNAVASVNVRTAITPTMAVTGEATTAVPAVPGVVVETPAPASAGGQQATSSDLDALLAQMQDTMQSMQGMVGQLDQKSAGVLVLPTATPAAATIDLQPYMTELQSINQAMVPLMQHIQADLQGNPSPEELASVRAQVAEIQTRMLRLINQVQAARNGAVGEGQTVSNMPWMYGMPQAEGQIAMERLQTAMQHIQGMLQQAQSRQQSGMTAQPGEMDSMMAMMDDMMSKMEPMMGDTSSQPGQSEGMGMATPQPGMPSSTTSGGGMMGDMMNVMEAMIQMMDDVMKMDGM